MNLYSQLLDLGIDPSFIDAAEFAAAGGIAAPSIAPATPAVPSAPKMPALPKTPATPKLRVPKIKKGPGVTLPTGVHIPQPSAPHVAINVHAPGQPSQAPAHPVATPIAKSQPVKPMQPTPVAKATAQQTGQPLPKPKAQTNAGGTSLSKLYAGRLGVSSGISPQNNQFLFGQAKTMGLPPKKVELISQYITASQIRGNSPPPQLPKGIKQSDINAYRAASQKWSPQPDPTKDKLVEQWFNQAFDANGNVVVNPPPLPVGLSYTDIVNWNTAQSGDFLSESFDSPEAARPLK